MYSKWTGYGSTARLNTRAIKLGRGSLEQRKSKEGKKERCQMDTKTR